MHPPSSCARRAGLLGSAALMAMSVAAMACQDRIEEVIHIRSSCETCHQPLDDKGVAGGLEEIHPWGDEATTELLTCDFCHGGSPFLCDGELGEPDEEGGIPTCDGEWIFDKAQAHVAPGEDDPDYLRNLSAGELDEVDPAYLRFINPGDLRVVAGTCGACHYDAMGAARDSTMAHTSGELTVARYRSGAQRSPTGFFGAIDLVDEAFEEVEDNLCASPALEQFTPVELDTGEDNTDEETMLTVANVQDQYLAKSCLRCHLNDFGENVFQGDFRSSGCTACHMNYANDGLSQSADPRVNKQSVPHPITHELTRSPTVDQCVHCHYRGGRIGIGFQGYRESAGPGLNPDNPDSLGEALHGHDAAFYLVDEDTTNDWDETPPDAHFEAGMHCVDCHTTTDVHGDGHIYADTMCAVYAECTDCHGTIDERATLAKIEAQTGERLNITEKGGELWLTGRVTGAELYIPQIVDSVDPDHERYSPLAAEAMGKKTRADGTTFSHLEEVECYTCHAAWYPSCYGCHVRVDFTRESRYHATGELVAGQPTGSRRWVVLNDLVLMRNVDGLMAPSMPAERFFMTALVPDEEAEEVDGETPKKTLFADKPRTFTFKDGRTIPGFGQRAFNPHTTRKLSQFTACDRCHSVADAADPATEPYVAGAAPEKPDNEILLDLTHGFGTERFLQKGCNVDNEDESCDEIKDSKTYALDAVITREGEPLVAVGHPEPKESRVLTLEEIDAMRRVVIPRGYFPVETEVAEDALTNPWWPKAQQLE